MRLSFTQRLAQPEPILSDGAMGTLLVQRGSLPLKACFDAVNIEQPDLVRDIHRSYIDAGAEMLESNTFGANRFKLAEHGLRNQVTAVNRAGVRLAREAAVASGRPGVFVAGSVGPLGAGIKPYGRIAREEAREAFHEQISALVEAGADLLVMETFADHDELLLAVAVAQEIAPELPIVAQATFSADSTTFAGYPPARVASDLYRAGVTVIGVNCGSGPSHISSILQIMRSAVPDALLSAMPNAGFPEAVGGRIMYPATEEYFGEYALTFRTIGARVIGGCCGTTPAHIAAMRQALDDPQARQPEIQVVDGEVADAEPTPLRPTHLAERLAQGEFTVTVEMTPPRSYAVDALLTEARLLRSAGAALIDVADTPAARMKMSAWAVSHVIQDHVGIETVLHFPTRGRNLLRVQGDLLAAHALGLRNLFVTMGDPTRIGDYPDAMDSYDIVPSRLIELIKQGMNAGRDMAGNSIGQPTSFTVGCALNMAADDLEREIKVLNKKLAAGADFALGQPVFDPPRVDAFLRKYEEINGEAFRLPVIMGVIPLYSVRHAQFLHNEVPGITIPQHIFKRLEDAGDDAPREGVKIACELIARMRDRVQGAYIIPSYARYNLAAEVCDSIVNAPVQSGI